MVSFLLTVFLPLALVSTQLSDAARIVGYPMFGGSQYIGMERTMASFLLPLALVSTQLSDAARIVGYPMYGGSQYIGMKRIGQELASRGHKFTLLVSSIQKINPSTEIKHAVYKVPFEKDFMEKVFFKRAVKGGIRGLLSSTGTLGMLEVFCEATLNASHVLNPMKDYDMIITDTSMLCGPLVAEYLNITRVEYCPITHRNPIMYQHVPTYLSYVPQLMSRIPGKMSFLQRVKNTLVYLAGQAITHAMIFPTYDNLKRRYNISPERSYAESMGDAELVLFLSDVALDYSYPMLPGHKLIGPVNMRPPLPLSPEFQQLMDSSGEDGAIIVSFGSNVAASLDKKHVDMMADAFGRLKEKVFWGLKGYIPAGLASNIKIVEWLPQNDLLAHPKLRAFVSHLGQNSLYESVSRGVPLVGAPLFADQPGNAGLVEDKGLGLAVDIHTVTAEKLCNTIRRVIDDPRFKSNVERISRLMNDRRRTPTQEAADWIEYTLRHGRLKHLRPASVHLTWYQYFLVDVMFFLGMVLLAVAMVVRLIWRCVCWVCCRRTKKTKVQ